MAKIEPANLLLTDKDGNTGLVKSLTSKDITTLKGVVTNVDYIKDYMNTNNITLPVQGDIHLTATDEEGNNGKTLLGTSSGTLTWGGKNLVTSVNGNKADSNGNVSNALDYSNKIEFTGDSITYTCPSDGWIFMSGSPTSLDGHVYVNNVTVNTVHHRNPQTYTNGVNVQMIVNKGDIVKTNFATYTTNKCLYYFVPFKGV